MEGLIMTMKISLTPIGTLVVKSQSQLRNLHARITERRTNKYEEVSAHSHIEHTPKTEYQITDHTYHDMMGMETSR